MMVVENDDCFEVVSGKIARTLYGGCVVYDTETKVMYYLTDYGMSPLYNADGSLKLYRNRDIHNGIMSVENVYEFIDTEPTVDAVPVVHGKWETNTDRSDMQICSVCKRGYDMWKHDSNNYCPHCGAKMDLEG